MKNNCSIKSAQIGIFSIALTLITFVFQQNGLAQTNLLTNGGFEDKTTGWTVWGASLATTTDSHTGVYAAKVTNRKNPWDALVRDVTAHMVNGDIFALSTYVKFPNATTNFRATLQLNSDSGTNYYQFFKTDAPKIGSYQFYTDVIQVAWTGNLLSAFIYFESDDVGGVYSDYQVDDVELVRVIPEPDAAIEGEGFKDIKSTMRIGGCVAGTKNYFTHATAKEQVLKDCNTVTITCYPAWGRWDENLRHVYHVQEFSDKIQEMKRQNLHVIAHMLLGWDQYFPAWYKNDDFPADTLEAIMKSWLDAIIKHQGNDTLVDVWNIVNEAISWDGKGGYWPDNHPDKFSACEMQRMGFEADASGLTGSQFVNAQHPVYIRKSFEYARTLTKKKLELRDSGFEFPTDAKYNAIYQLAVHLKNMNAPVDAIGFQTHIDIEKNYDWEGYTNNIKRYVALGYEVYIPEVDIGDVAKKWSDDKANLQKMQYYKLVTAAIKGGATEMQTWGFIDDNEDWRKGENAFPYTNKFVVKPAYYGIQEALTDLSSFLFWEMDAPMDNKMPDVMKYNNYGTMNNFSAPQFVTGFKSKALQFDGIDDNISTGVLTDSISGNFTFTCFVKTASTNAAVIADLGVSGVSGLKIEMSADGRISLNAAESGLSQDLTSSIAINDDKWHYIALQRDSTSYRLYIDSATTNIAGQGTVSMANQLTLGAKIDGSLPFQGIVDEVKLYDAAVEEGSFTRSMVPYSPGKLSRTASKMVVKLTWTDLSTNEDGFLIERKIADSGWVEHARVGAGVLKFNDTLALYSTEHFYRVMAYTRFGNSVPTNTVSYITPKDPNTGINSQQVNTLSIEPNPVIGKFTLKGSEEMEMKIYNLHGQLLMEKQNCEATEVVDISHFSNGIYLLQASNQNFSNAIKLVKN
jgi:GH35 family endo-1,4-beta-xylanase